MAFSLLAWFSTSVGLCEAFLSLPTVEKFHPEPVQWLQDRRSSWCSLSTAGFDEHSALRGREVTVAIIHDPHDIRVLLDENGMVVGGHTVRIWEELARQGGFSWKGFIAPTRMANMTYLQMVLALASKYDVVLDIMAVTPQRRELGLTFFWPIADVSPVLVTRMRTTKPRLSQVLFSFLRPFDAGTWTAVLLSFVLTAVCYMLVEWPGDDLKGYRHRFSHAMGQAMYLTVGSFTGGASFSPATRQGKFIVTAWTFAMLLLTSAYTANLASLLIVHGSRTGSLTGFDDASRRRAPLCADPTIGSTTAVREKYPDMLLVPGQREFETGGLQALEQLGCDGVVVPTNRWMVMRSNPKLNPSCQLGAVGGHEGMRLPGSFALKLEAGNCNFKLKHVISALLQDLHETGLSDAIFKEELRSHARQDCDWHVAEDGPLSMKDTGGIFALILLAVLAALCWHAYSDGFQCNRTWDDAAEEEEVLSNSSC